jgi:long-subunit fatty acid transport protein
VTAQEGTGRYWDAQDLAFAFSYARNFTDRFSLGGSVKYIHQAIANESAHTMAVDIGLLYYTGIEGLKLAMTIANYGGKMKMDGKDLLVKYDIDPENSGHNETLVAKKKTDEWPLPIFFRIGAAMDVLQIGSNSLTLAVDALHPTDNVETMNLGAEYRWNEMISIRGGYKSLFMDESIEGLTLGAGIQYLIPNYGKFSVDYSYADFDILGDVQTFALTITF